jgi:multidrug transporter EmrE-like cation transporter
MLYYFAVALTILSGVLYHVFLKLTPGDVHPFISLIATYVTSIVLCVGALLFSPLQTRLVEAFGELNWTSYALAAAIVGLEVGSLLAYRAGWRISNLGVVVNVAVMILLVPVGLLIFEERLSPVNVIGILIAIVGLVMMNLR